jgi:hypothetical protein
MSVMEIAQFSGSNLSGLKEISYVYPTAISSIGYPDSNNKVDVELAPNSEWKQIYFTQNTAKMELVSKIDDSGVHYQVNIRFKIPKTEGSTIVKLDALKNRELVLKVTDLNELTWLIGNADQPVTLSFGMSNDAGGFNSFEITFSCISDTLPRLIDDETVLSGGFSSGFSAGFDI